MFILRTIEEERENVNKPFEQVISNFELGNAYSRLRNGATKEFDLVMDKEYPQTDKSKIDSLICGENGLTFFISTNDEDKHFSYFIMTESGKTFERLN